MSVRLILRMVDVLPGYQAGLMSIPGYQAGLRSFRSVILRMVNVLPVSCSQDG